MLLAGPFAGRLLGRHGRRDHQGRAARPARSDARVGQGALRGPLAVVAGAVAQQEVRDAQPARRSAARSSCSTLVEQRGRPDRELPARARSSAGTSARAALGGEPAARDRAHLGLRADRPVRAARGLRLRVARRWAASGTSTASRTSRRRACTSRSATRSPACSPRRASSPRSTGATRSAAAAARSSTSRCSSRASRCSRAWCPSTTGSAIVRGPGGTGLKGIAPSNIFKSRDGKWIVIAANADNVFRRLCEAMGQPELADDARFVDAPRARRAPGGDRGHRRRLGRRARRRRDRPRAERGRRHLRPDLHDRRHLRGRALPRPRHARSSTTIPEFGEYIGPGIVPKFSETPGEVRWSATWEEGSHNARRLRRPARALRRTSSRR